VRDAERVRHARVQVRPPVEHQAGHVPGNDLREESVISGINDAGCNEA
jgi:hypothetical protein